jgi:hypothetical protein
MTKISHHNALSNENLQFLTGFLLLGYIIGTKFGNLLIICPNLAGGLISQISR